MDLVASVLAAAPRAGRTRLVAVDGRSGSGKTTLATRLGLRLACPVVHLDDVYPGWEGLASGVEHVAVHVVEALSQGRHARWRRYDWTHQRYAEWHDVPSAETVIVEGVGAGALPQLSLLVWLECDAGTRKQRALRRDGDLFAPFWELWAEQEDAYVAGRDPRSRADIVIDCQDEG